MILSFKAELTLAVLYPPGRPQLSVVGHAHGDVLRWHIIIITIIIICSGLAKKQSFIARLLGEIHVPPCTG